MWKLSEVWNKSISQKEEYPAKPRNRMWASELGKANVDIFLKMKGVEPSNPFDARAKRKFEAGNLFEWVVEIILKRAGIYQESQKWIGYRADNDCIDVTGKLDHIAGGIPDYEKAKADIEAMGLPDLFTRATDNILTYFKEAYPDGLPTQGIEVKSTSSYGIEKVYDTGRALAGHDLQAFHYAFNENMPFTLLYISKDDLRMAELPILPDNEELNKQYHEKIRLVSDFYNRDVQPDPEPLIVFDEKMGKFSKNFNVEYSPYLTMLYGFETQEEYYDKYGKMIESWNRVCTRIKDGKELTANNQEKIAEMQKMGYDITKLITA